MPKGPPISGREKATGKYKSNRDKKIKRKIISTIKMGGVKSRFSFAVLKEVSKIRAGSVCSYSEIAARIGCAGAARAVGTVLRRNERPVTIPCHRVVRKDGTPGGYSRGIKEKLKLLKSEGMKIKREKGIWKVQK